MESTALYTLAVYDRATEDRLSAMRRALFDAGFIGRETGGIPYHITLSSFPLDREAELTQRLARAAARVPAFELPLSSLGLFGMNVLFIAPAVNRPLLDLRDELGEEAGWTAHTTMLIDDAETIQAALPLLAGLFKPFVARVEAVRLYEFWPSRLIAEERLR